MNTTKRFFFLYLLLFSTQAHAKTCENLFQITVANVQSPLEKAMDFASKSKRAIADLSEDFAENSKALHVPEGSNKSHNVAVLNIVDLNNKLLDFFEFVVGNREKFSSPAGKMFYQGIIDQIVALFKKQGFSREEASQVLQARFTEMQRSQILEGNRKSRPIGFSISDDKETGQAADRKPHTIGFSQAERLANPYGRQSKRNERDHAESSNSDRQLRRPIGFLHQDSLVNSPSEPLRTIGFLGADAQDVSYRLALSFDYENSIFLAVSNRQPIGFRTE